MAENRESSQTKDTREDRSWVSVECLESDHHYFEASLTTIDLSEQSLEAIEFERCLLTNVTAQKSKWLQTAIADTQFRDCNWTTARLERGFVDGAQFVRCRLTGMEVFEAQFRNTALRNSKLDLASVHQTKWRDCTFNRCDLQSVDFQGCDLRSVVFRECDLRNTRLLGNRLREIDVRGSQIEGLQIEIENLRHLTIDPTQVSYVASLTGIKVCDVELE